MDQHGTALYMAISWGWIDYGGHLWYKINNPQRKYENQTGFDF